MENFVLETGIIHNTNVAAMNVIITLYVFRIMIALKQYDRVTIAMLQYNVLIESVVRDNYRKAGCVVMNNEAEILNS